MTTSLPHSQITDELLSAYIDGNVSESERDLIESATQRDIEVAWRLETLRQTVQLVRALPQVALPKSFSVEAVLASERGAQQARTPWSRPAVPEEVQVSWWHAFLDFWRSGSPILRNAAVGAMALFLVLGLGSQTVLVSNQIATPAAIQQLGKQQTVEPMAVETARQVQNREDATNETTANVDALGSPTASANPGDQAEALAFDATSAEVQPAAQPAAESAPLAQPAIALPVATTDDAVVAAASASVEDEAQFAAASAPVRESAPGIAAKVMDGPPNGAEGNGAEDATAFDAAMLESVEAAPELMQMAPAREIAAAPSGGGEEGDVARSPAAAVELPAPAASIDSPTPLPTATAIPTLLPAPPTIAPMADKSLAAPSQTMQDSARLRVNPPSGEVAAESSSLPAWLRMMQLGAAILAPLFFVLWLRSRRVDGKR